MSFAIMPALPISMAKGLHKTPSYSTVLQKTAAMRTNASVALMPFPTWEFEFDLDKITGNEASSSSVISQFLGTFMACQGNNLLFLFTDPQDHSVALANSGMANVTAGAAAPMGIKGDGTSTQFQLTRSIGLLASDVVQSLNGAPVIKVNGSTLTVGTDYSITNGVVTFVSAPANNATLQWSGSFYFTCRFSEDTVDAVRAYTANTGTDIWDVSAIKFASEFI